MYFSYTSIALTSWNTFLTGERLLQKLYNSDCVSPINVLCKYGIEVFVSRKLAKEAIKIISTTLFQEWRGNLDTNTNCIFIRCIKMQYPIE